MKSFGDYNSLMKEAVAIPHAKPSGKQYRLMLQETKTLPVDSDGILVSAVSAPPDNSSPESRVEIMELQDRLEYAQDALGSFERWDDNVVDPFVQFLESNNVVYDREALEMIAEDCHIIALRQKFHFNRPRPKTLAETIDMRLRVNTNHDSPSYPSSHATQAFFIAHVLGDTHPEHKEAFRTLAEQCSESRLNVGVNYSSDCECADSLAFYLYTGKTDT